MGTAPGITTKPHYRSSLMRLAESQGIDSEYKHVRRQRITTGERLSSIPTVNVVMATRDRTNRRSSSLIKCQSFPTTFGNRCRGIAVGVARYHGSSCQCGKLSGGFLVCFCDCFVQVMFSGAPTDSHFSTYLLFTTLFTNNSKIYVQTSIRFSKRPILNTTFLSNFIKCFYFT